MGKIQQKDHTCLECSTSAPFQIRGRVNHTAACSISSLHCNDDEDDEEGEKEKGRK